MRLRHTMMAGLVVAALATSCQGDGGDPVADVSGTTPTTSSVQTTGGNGGGGKASTDAPLPDDQPNLDLEQRHPNGTVLRITGISFDQASMTLRVEAINGFVKAIDLNAVDMQLVDDLGNIYNFVTATENPSLRIESGGTLTGDLTFLGRLDRAATSLRLVVNDYGTDPINVAEDFSESTTPRFDLGAIPVARS